ncbi:hypothetical protein, partial [Erwinia sp. PsM31]|uniref:hypothetical protein n=1 Tax=Erwinia sp. PsM31 TaxID=3030535 RepID=UPI00263BCE4F
FIYTATTEINTGYRSWAASDVYKRLTYARSNTDVLMSKRLRSQLNAVVDSAPEHYQKLRQKFVSEVTVQMMY